LIRPVRGSFRCGAKAFDVYKGAARKMDVVMTAFAVLFLFRYAAVARSRKGRSWPGRSTGDGGSG
jgi:hypothetical protein